MENLEIAKIRRDGGTQPRAALDQATIEEYVVAMERGDTFPPVVVFFDGTDYWLADGFHRAAAAEFYHPLHVSIAVIVHQGSQRDAILYSTGANAEHGLRRNNADKRRSVDVMLRDPQWATWSDREIARQCRVSNHFVSAMRQELSVIGSQIDPPTERTVTRSGTTYTMNTAPIGTAQPEYASIEQLTGPVRAAVRKLWPETAKMMLTQVNAMNGAGAEVVEKIHGEPSIPKPARRADIRTVCRAYLTELTAASRPAAQVVYTGVQDTGTRGQGDTGITVEATGPGIRSEEEVEAAAAALEPDVWRQLGFVGPASMASREQLANAKRLTGSLLDLEGFHAKRGRNFDWEAFTRWFGPAIDQEALRLAVAVVRGRILAIVGTLPEPEPLPAPEPEPEDEPADLATVVIRWLEAKVEENAIPEGVEESRYVLRGILTGRHNGFALAWRELKTQGHWPAGTQDGAKLDAVRAALAQLGGEVPQPAPVERVYVRPGVVPTIGQAMNEIDRLNAKLRDLVELNAKQAERIHSQVVAIDKALGYLKSLASAEEEAIDDDLIETIAALEAAR